MKKIEITLNQEAPLYIQIYEKFVIQMTKGYITQGEKLPSVRYLANQLGVSKSTIENAYDRLLSEGYIVSKEKSGYFCDLPEIKKEKKESLIEFPSINETSYLYDFSSRLMDYENFDQKVWIRYTKEVLENGALMAGYGHSQGEQVLREQLSKYLHSSRHLQTKENQLLIGAGISPLLYFICSLFKKQTLKVGFLQPGFIQAMHIFEDCHHEIILLDSLEDLKTTPLDLFYLTPSSLNLNLKERRSLLKLLKDKNIYLIEDDLNGDMYYKTTPLPCMQSLYDEDMVFYLSSFSRLLLPSVRLAVLAIPQTFKFSLNHYNQTASRIEQQVFAMYLQDGHLERRIRRLKRHYLKKYQLMNDLLSKYFKEVHLIEPNLCIEIHDDFSSINPDQTIQFQKIDNHTIRLYFSGMNINNIEKGLYYFIEKWKK